VRRFALRVLTEWNEFRALDLKRAYELMAGNVLVDLQNVYAEGLAKEAGFYYHGIGRTAEPIVSRPYRQQMQKANMLRDAFSLRHQPTTDDTGGPYHPPARSSETRP
jgi:hypothetical protein